MDIYGTEDVIKKYLNGSNGITLNSMRFRIKNEWNIHVFFLWKFIIFNLVFSFKNFLCISTEETVEKFSKIPLWASKFTKSSKLLIRSSFQGYRCQLSMPFSFTKNYKNYPSWMGLIFNLIPSILILCYPKINSAKTQVNKVRPEKTYLASTGKNGF